MKIIQVDHLSFAYRPGGREVLKDISFEVRQGEVVGIVGPSGCGKSTLCACLNGVIPHCIRGQMRGNVLVNGKNTRNERVGALSREIGTVFQDPDTQLFSPTVEDEIAFALENLGFPPARIRQKVDGVMDLLGIAHLAAKGPSELSGGEKQMVVLAAVLTMEPRILVLDEALSYLDVREKKRMVGVLGTLREQGTTILMVEHDLDAVAFADRILVLDQGAVIRSDSMQKVIKDTGFLQAGHLIF